MITFPIDEKKCSLNCKGMLFCSGSLVLRVKQYGTAYRFIYKARIKSFQIISAFLWTYPKEKQLMKSWCYQGCVMPSVERLLLTQQDRKHWVFI